MKCVVKTTHRKNGISFYFVRLRNVDGVVNPVYCQKYRANKVAAIFPSIASACAVVRQIDSTVWSCRIRPAFRLFCNRQGGVRVMYTSAFWRIAEALRDIARAIVSLFNNVGRVADSLSSSKEVSGE